MYCTPCYLNQKTVLKCVQEKNNLNIDKPKSTVCKELTASACLFGKENISDTDRWYSKGPKENAELISFSLICKNTCYAKDARKVFSISFLSELLLELLQRHFAIVNTKGRGLSGSQAVVPMMKVWGLWHTHASYSLLWSSVLQLTQPLFFSMSWFCHKVSEPFACGFRSSPASSEGTASGKDSLAKGSCPRCQDKAEEGSGFKGF